MFSPRKLQYEIAMPSRTPPKKSPPSTPTTLPQTPTQQKADPNTFITSSPRTPKTAKATSTKDKLSKFRSVASPSKTMFSPTYTKSLSIFSKGKASPRSKEIGQLETSPIKQRLQHNLALHGNKAQEFDEYDEEEFDPWRFIALLPPLQRRPFSNYCIPPKVCGRPTLVLDLDETLVHCSTNPEEVRDPHFTFEVDFNGQIYRVAAKKRPGLEEFMEYTRDRFEVIIFTASQRIYADKILDLLDPRREFFRHRVFRDDCVNVEGNYLKDLTVLGRDLAKTVIVDNSPQAFSYQLENGLPILSWFESEHDRELFKIIPLLERLCSVDDFRPVLKEHFKLYKKVQQKAKQLSWM